MSNTEELQEVLLDLERARFREGKLRAEAEALVAGLAVLTRSGGTSARIQGLLDVLRGVFTYEDAFVLLLHEDGLLRTAATTNATLATLAVQPMALFQRVLAGQSVAVFDVDHIAEWKSLQERMTSRTKSALHIPLGTGILICTHHERGFFKAAQTELAKRFAPLASELLARAELERTAQQRDRFFTLTLDMMCILDASLQIRQLSRGWDALGYAHPNLIGRPLLDFVHADDRARAEVQLAGAQKSAGTTFESRMVGADGVARWLLWNVSRDPDDGLVYAAARDISDLKETQRVLEERTRQLDMLAASLREAAFSDALTGLRNRRYFDERINEDVAVVRRAYAAFHRQAANEVKNGALAFLMIDLDLFKRINDVHGHDAGDAVLVEVAQRLLAAIREVDSAIRWGGEEFLVVLRNVDPMSIGLVAERIRAALSSKPFVLPDGHALRVTCSVGYAHAPLGPVGVLQVDDLLKLADAAVYRAKHLGRDRVVGVVEGDSGITTATPILIREDVARATSQGHVRFIDADSGTTMPPVDVLGGH